MSEKIPKLPRNATASEIQAHQLAKLLKDPEKPVHIPKPAFEGVRKLRDPRETMKNVQGSSAGAGSGEFHVYKQSRRREYERLKIMDEEEAYHKEKADALARHDAYQSAADEKTAKNRLKRQRKKASRKGGKGGSGGAAGSDDDESEQRVEEGGSVEKKRKIGGSGVQFSFRKPGEEGYEDEDEEEEQGPSPPKQVNGDELPVKIAAAAIEAGISIRDED
ncbi:DUF1168-domain-containing protein [Meredithblackwellia eburnea MCA 4105]